MNVIEYFAPGLASIEDVEAKYGPLRDATTLSKVADCPRLYEIRVVENLTSKSVSAKMVAGIALHEGLDLYYSYPDRSVDIEARAVQAMLDSWRSFGIDRGLMQPNETHLSEEHLEAVLRNYFLEWNVKKIETLTPIVVDSIDDLDLSQVVAARFKLNDEDNVILAESSLIMKFDVDGEELILCGKPDLPAVKQDGRAYAMDHKTTSSYLSEYWAKTHEVSNKDRGYLAMLESLLDRPFNGSIINGIYVGKSATNPNSKATRTERYQFDFTPDHITEALRNQLMWNKTIEFYEEQGYFPQGCGYGGCSCPSICKVDPIDRADEKMKHWEQSDRHFWDL